MKHRALEAWAVAALLAYASVARAAPDRDGEVGAAAVVAGECSVIEGAPIAALLRCVRGAPSLGNSGACDTNGDGSVTADEVVAAVARVLWCGGAPTPTPTPRPIEVSGPSSTPTRALVALAGRVGCGGPGAKPCVARGTAPRPCGAQLLAGMGEILQAGATVGGSLQFGGVNCGTRGGGTGAPERVFEFVAPAAAEYEIAVEGQGFSPLLHVRRDSCQGAYVGCDVDTLGNAPLLVLALEAGARVAIIVDGNGAGRQGAFTLRIGARRPDLVVRSIAAPGREFGGEQVALAAEIANQGTADAGPFTVELLYARDAQLLQPLGSASATCDVEGLAAGAVRVCRPVNALAVPRVAEGSYFVGARADSTDAVMERDEGNNTASAPSAIDALGVELVHRLFRTGFNVYQLVYARPALDGSDEEHYRISTIAGSIHGVGGCLSESLVGGPAGARFTGATVGPERAPDNLITYYAGIQRTAILEPNDARIAFDFKSAVLTLGSGGGAIRVCRGGCAGQPLFALDAAAPSACYAPALLDGIDCSVGAASTRTAIAFGIPAVQQSIPVCSTTVGITSQQECGPEPGTGIRLLPGQAIVFAYDVRGGLSFPAVSTYKAGVAGFSIDTDAVNTRGCPAGTVLTGVLEVGSTISSESTSGFQTPTPGPTPTPRPAPANDLCPSAATVAATPFEATASTILASTAPDDPPTGCTASRGHTVWYRVPAAPTPRAVRVRAFGYDTVLSAFTGTCGALVPVPGGCNDDERSGVYGSRLDLTLEAGQTYHVMVSSFGATAGGSLTFTVE